MVPTRDTQTRRQSGTHRRVSECLQGPQGSVSGLVRVEKHLTGLCSGLEWKAKAAGDHAPSRRSLCLAHSIFQCSSVGPGRNSSVRVLFEGEMGLELGCQRVKSQPHPDHRPALWTQATQQPPPGPRRTLTRHPGPACLSHPTSTCDFRRLQKPISINTKQTAARIAHLPNSLPLFCEPSHRNARCILGPRNTAQPRRRIAPLAHPVFRSFASLPLPSAHNLVDIFQVQDIPSRGVAQPWLRLLQRKVLPGRLWIS